MEQLEQLLVYFFCLLQWLSFLVLTSAMVWLIPKFCLSPGLAVLSQLIFLLQLISVFLCPWTSCFVWVVVSCEPVFTDGYCLA